MLLCDSKYTHIYTNMHAHAHIKKHAYTYPYTLAHESTHIQTHTKLLSFNRCDIKHKVHVFITPTNNEKNTKILKGSMKHTRFKKKS